jgi:hypothetical protein
MNKHAQALGRLGGKAGKGNAKARTKEQAQAAAKRRWQLHFERLALIPVKNTPSPG